MSVQLGFKANEVIAEGRVTNDDIDQIKIWLEKHENLPLISDEEIINFLLSNDNDQENTKNTITAFFQIRNEGPDIFNNRIISEENFKSKQFAYFGISPKRTEDNCAVILTQLNDSNTSSFNIYQFFKFLFMTLDAAIYSNPPSGLIIVIDLNGCGLLHLAKLRVNAISIFFRYLQEALPVKLKNIHVVNTVYFIDKVLAIIKPFMNNNVKQLMIFHKRGCNMDEFFEKHVAKEFLPENLGGDLPCIKALTEQVLENLKNLELYFKAEEDRRSTLKWQKT